MIVESFKTKIKYECDVLVCGGGFGGVSAALAAAREGKKVILLEKEYILGGLGTAGLVTVYLPLCDGMGRQVSFGIAEELLKLSISMGAEADYPKNWLDNIGERNEKTPRYLVRYNASLCAILMEKLLLKEGVMILYGTYAVKTDMNGDRINAVIIENKSGRQAVRAKTYVDATGDSDIAHLAGVKTENFKQGNVLAAWYYFLNESGFGLKMLGASDIPDEQKSQEQKERDISVERFSGLDGEEISQMVQKSHAKTLEDIKEKRKTDKTTVPTSIATIPQIRMTRKIVGEYVLDSSEQHKYFEDSIGMVSDWRKRGPVWEVPFGTLYSKEIKNLITAGRCTSVTEAMWDVMRVIPCCAVTGQAAGTAAALCEDFSQLDVSLLQQILTKNGVILHEKDL